MLTWSIIEQEECAQSMTWMRQRYTQLPHGTVLHTKHLVQAQGRQDRVWHVRKGQLLLTLLLKSDTQPPTDPVEADIWWASVAMACSLGVQQPLAAYGVGLKWPNDLVARGKKVGGILIHTVWEGDKPAALIVGIGINGTNTTAGDSALQDIAISLQELTPEPVNLHAVRDTILQSLEIWYERWTAQKTTDIYKAWRRLVCNDQAALVQFHDLAGNLLTGQLIDALPDGSILLRTADGVTRPVPLHLTQAR